MSTNGKDAEIFNLGAILPNIPGQQYIFGNKDNPGIPENPKEYFIPCPFLKVEPRHCMILVDEDGEFWIENLDESAKTCINQKPLKEKKKLSFGDIISFGGNRSSAYTYLEFKERRRRENTSKTLPGSGGREVAAFPPIASDVGGNHVLVKMILGHFSVIELKEYRFVSQEWNSAASQLLRKRCAVSIPEPFPQFEQTKLFRCSKEMETFASNMTSLSVEIPNFPTDLDGNRDAEKFVQDLVKYQLKDSLTYFKIFGELSDGRAPFLDTVLQTVSQACPQLEHVVFDIGHECGSSADFELPNSNWTFGPNLKILEVSDWCVGQEFPRSVLQKMDTTSLEKFKNTLACDSDFLFVMAYDEMNFSNMKEISLKSFNGEDLKALVKLPSNVRLQKLVLNEICNEPTDIVSLTQGFSDVFVKFKQTLVSLTMDCRGENVVFPSFENLEVLSLLYDGDTRVTLPPNFLYSKHFPKLKSLTLKSRKIGSDEDTDTVLSDYRKAEALSQWGLNEEVFNSFITNGQVCSSLLELDIPHCPPEEMEENKEYEDRLKAMRTVFPNVKGKWIKAGK